MFWCVFVCVVHAISSTWPLQMISLDSLNIKDTFWPPIRLSETRFLGVRDVTSC